jgi:hypothetical protein
MSDAYELSKVPDTQEIARRIRIMRSVIQCTLTDKDGTTVNCTKHKEEQPSILVKGPVNNFSQHICARCWEEMMPEVCPVQTPPTKRRDIKKCLTCCLETSNYKNCARCEEPFCHSHLDEASDCCYDCLRFWEAECGQLSKSNRGS